MSWIGWLMLLGMFGVVVVAVRGIVQMVSWLIEEYVIEPRELRRRNGDYCWSGHERSRRRLTGRRRRPNASLRTRSSIVPSDHPDRSANHPAARWLKGMVGMILRKDYDYWVALALAQEDMAVKIDYLSKALAAEPDVRSGLGDEGQRLVQPPAI